MTGKKSLTIPPSRLAGSAQCLNCGTSLKGPFCYYCGQPDKNFMRFFPVLLREFLEDFLELDSRFARTMKPLLFIPGKLTRDYLDGKRFRFTPPLRLYIFSSMLFFILAAMLAGNAITIDTDAVDKELALSDTINLNGEPWDKETNPVTIPFMPDFVNNWINDEIEESPQKGREIGANPNLILAKIFDVLPMTMFVLLPLAALLFKFWYLFARKYYIEHLIFALHNHSFLFVIFLLSMLLNALAGWLEPGEEGPVSTTIFWINTTIYTWIPVYFLLSMKRVYQQSWAMTLAKYVVIGLSYIILLSLATSVAAVLSFVLL